LNWRPAKGGVTKTPKEEKSSRMDDSNAAGTRLARPGKNYRGKFVKNVPVDTCRTLSHLTGVSNKVVTGTCKNEVIENFTHGKIADEGTEDMGTSQKTGARGEEN